MNVLARAALRLVAPGRVHVTDVRATARALDVVAPGWYRQVRLDRLDMGSVTACVAGQVFGHHDDGRRALNLGASDDRRDDRRDVRAFERALGASCPTGPWHDEVNARRDADDDRALARLLAAREATT